MRGNYNPSIEGDKSGGCSKKTPLYITRLVMFIFLEGLVLHTWGYAAQLLGVVVNNVLKASQFVIVHGSKDRTFQSIGTII